MTGTVPFAISRAILLIALGLGYVVCYLANRQEKTLKSIGYLIGTFIIVLSAVLILGNLLLNAMLYTKTCIRRPKHWMMMKGAQSSSQMPIPTQPQK